MVGIPDVLGAKDTYYVYVDEIPYWANNAGNAVYEATEFWKENNDWLNFYTASSSSTADIHIQWVKEFGTETVGHAVNQWFVEVGLGDSVCHDEWQPFSETYVTNIMAHEIGHVLELDHTDDPDDIMYPIAYNLEYGIVEQEFTIRENYGQFVGLCTVKDITTIDYWVEVDDPTYGFDVYVVPSMDSFDDWADAESFTHYSGDGCFSEGYLAVGATCHGVEQGSGLLILMDSEITNPLVTLTVKMQEVSTSGTVGGTLEQEYYFDTGSGPTLDDYFNSGSEPTLDDYFEQDPGQELLDLLADSDNDGIADYRDKCKFSKENFQQLPG